MFDDLELERGDRLGRLGLLDDQECGGKSPREISHTQLVSFHEKRKYPKSADQALAWQMLFEVVKRFSKKAESNPLSFAFVGIGSTKSRDPIRAIIGGKGVNFSSNEEKFKALAEDWLDQQSGKSRIDFSHPSHLQIIGMGPIAIPFLLAEIREQSGHWFQAIRSITGASPVSLKDRGDFEAATTAWLKWGTDNGYGKMEDRERDVDEITSSKD